MENNHFTFIANWKMALNIDEELQFASSNFDKLIQLTEKNEYKIILCPSFVSLYPLCQIFKETKIGFGAQNCSGHNKGAFTGQISSETLNLLGCKYCIIGHSESRKESAETDDLIAKKFNKLLSDKISPILCIGEKLEEHGAGKTLEVLQKELTQILQIVKNCANISNNMPIYIAYEPIWAIGTGKTPTQDHLETIFAWICNQTQKISSNIDWKLIYGGSVNSKNVKKIKKIQDLDGFLIGGSSLDFQEFEKIVKL